MKNAQSLEDVLVAVVAHMRGKEEQHKGLFVRCERTPACGGAFSFTATLGDKRARHDVTAFEMMRAYSFSAVLEMATGAIDRAVSQVV